MKTIQHCTNAPVVTDGNTGEVFCSACGSVLVDRIEDVGPEHYTYDPEKRQQNSRSGSRTSLTIDDMGLSTVIGTANQDATGKSLSYDMKNTFNRLRVWDSRSKYNSVERSLRTAFLLLDKIQQKLAIPDTAIESTAYLYRKAVAKKLTRGGSIASLLSAALYICCKQADIPRTLGDIADAANISVKELSRHLRLLVETFDLKLESYDSSDFVGRIASSVGISQKSQRGALEILADAKQKGLTAGKNPVALAATSLYLSCALNGEDKSQKRIADAAGITTVTVRSRAKFLVQALGLHNVVA